MKFLAYMFLIFVSTSSFCADQYANAKIHRVEACSLNGHHVLLYLEEITGTAPSSGDGCSNGGSYPFVRIASDQNPAGLNESFLSIALTAFASNKSIRVRYDDAVNQVTSLVIIH